ncbi:hypothetical protein [Candidatus Protochlamydia amoebophila]|uniref:Uncharacterized protein n=1 Tax=Protochlamydia amoebophila (strain UWE25) TaxID=264201 RepID=Q6MB96_PARUW|nr:hypothetical protein [Candidatus Protochlamydia amoebophila]CAF24153.1 unnamed protein product [Candidatus Protochlamydia amoebophila UWE25]
MVSKNRAFFPASFPLLGLMCLLLPSCAIYKQQFDCPAPKGIPCTSVTAIESLIVETQEGADFLVYPPLKDKKNEETNQGLAALPPRVWICNQAKEKMGIKGYYIQQAESIEPDLSFSINQTKGR